MNIFFSSQRKFLFLICIAIGIGVLFGTYRVQKREENQKMADGDSLIIDRPLYSYTVGASNQSFSNSGKKGSVLGTTDQSCTYAMPSVSAPTLAITPTPIPNTLFGSGIDGTCTVSGTMDITSAKCGSTRAGTAPDAVNFSVSTNVAAGATQLTLSVVPTGLSVGDEIFLINLQGTATNYTTVGQYEMRKILTISGNTLTFDAPLVNAYDGTTQKIMLQRIPQYADVTVSSGGTLTADAWNGTKNGVLAFRASGTVTVTGTVSMDGKGYRNGKNYTDGGESFCGNPGGGIIVTKTGAPAGTDYGDGTKGVCGGGGGAIGGGELTEGQQMSAIGGIGSTIGGAGGAAGGGSGGGGYGTGGGGGYAYGNRTDIGNPGVGTDGTDAGSGNGGNTVHKSQGAGSGGGGTYGDPWLTKLYFGSGAGGGGCNRPTTPLAAGGILLITGKTITVTGKITNGGLPKTQSDTCIGGSAGGSILFLGNALTLGDQLVTAIGGISGYHKTSTYIFEAPGKGNGGNGRIAVFYTGTLAGKTNPVAYTQKVAVQ